MQPAGFARLLKSYICKLYKCRCCVSGQQSKGKPFYCCLLIEGPDLYIVGKSCSTQADLCVAGQSHSTKAQDLCIVGQSTSTKTQDLCGVLQSDSTKTPDLCTDVQ